MTDWRKPCEHGKYDSHMRPIQEILDLGEWCPGGSPVEGEKVWWCESHHSTGNGIECDGYIAMDGHFKSCQMVGRLLIPIPDRGAAL